MGREALLEALRQEGERALAALHQRHDAEMAAREAAAQQRRDALRAAASRDWQMAAAAERQRCLAAGRRQTCALLLAGENALAERLRQQAAQLLPEVASRDPAALLRACAEELPPLSWAKVRVHPRDREVAARLFPSAEILPDPALSGGVVAETAEGRVRIDNSLEKRLERCWDDLLPELLAALERGDDDALAATP
ncbi:MAG: hypothetical protein A2005_11585 [Desulfuromonadales bacterium GWC2_61_20]|nr:MAG: hypothetical protein A2005_11585 [Desulfuromonadales bacterium GWC2_61_20]